jgi:hypothetical protein
LIHKILFTMLFLIVFINWEVALVLFKNLLKCLVSIPKVIWFALKKYVFFNKCVCFRFKKI